MPQYEERFRGNYEIIGHEEPTEDEKKEHERRMRLMDTQMLSKDYGLTPSGKESLTLFGGGFQESDEEGRWVTIQGNHIMIGDDGTIKSGFGKGKTPAQAFGGGEGKQDDEGQSERVIKIAGKPIVFHSDEYVADSYKKSTGSELEHGGSQGVDVRYTRSENPMSDYGHAMFVDATKEGRVESGYGDHRFIYDRSAGTDINELKSDIVSKWEEDKEVGFLPIGMEEISGEDAFKMFNPVDIVDSADAWDDGKSTQWFYERIIEPTSISAVNLNDGSVVFDKDLIKEIEPMRS